MDSPNKFSLFYQWTITSLIVLLDSELLKVCHGRVVELIGQTECAA